MTSDLVIQTQDLTKQYGTFEAVRSVSFQVARHRITGFLGRNGAGKSTTIKMLLGMVKPTSGSGRVLEYHIDNPGESVLLRRQVAYVGEDKGLYGTWTVEQLIRFTKSFYRDWRQDVERRLLKEYDLPAKRTVKALSKGMRTKLALLLALARRPALLILDEPTEGLDPVSIEELLQILAGTTADGTAVFFSSHQLSEVERIADDVLMIDRGRLVMKVSMDHLRQKYRRITAGFDGPPPEAEFQLPGVQKVRSNGRQVTILTDGNAEAIVARATNLGAVSVETSPVTLREVFLDMVKVGPDAKGA